LANFDLSRLGLNALPYNDAFALPRNTTRHASFFCSNKCWFCFSFNNNTHHFVKDNQERQTKKDYGNEQSVAIPLVEKRAAV